MKILKKMARKLAQKNFCKCAIEERADLSAFQEKLTPPIVTGLFLVAFSYVIGLPAVVAMGVIAVWLDKPLVGIIGGPLIYGISTLIFIIGLKLAGKKYFLALCRCLARVTLEKILGDEIKDICTVPPVKQENN